MYDTFTAVIWLSWLAYWLISPRNAKVTQRQETVGSRLTYMIPLWLGAILLAAHRVPGAWLPDRFLPWPKAGYWTGMAILLFGLSITVWARLHLGRNWSGAVTRKENHELIRTGPYHFVRHPIYTGLLVAILGTAILIGEWRALFGFALIAAALVRKAQIEERWLAEIFPDGYARYRAQVPALIPFIGRTDRSSEQTR